MVVCIAADVLFYANSMTNSLIKITVRRETISVIYVGIINGVSPVSLSVSSIPTSAIQLHSKDSTITDEYSLIKCTAIPSTSRATAAPSISLPSYYVDIFLCPDVPYIVFPLIRHYLPEVIPTARWFANRMNYALRILSWASQSGVEARARRYYRKVATFITPHWVITCCVGNRPRCN